MRKTISFLVALFMMATSNMYAQTIQIDPSQGNENGTSGGTTRSLNVSFSAYLNGSMLTIDYPMPTVSQVIIRDAETDAVVYSAPYDATRQVLINLSSLPEGTYELRLYAFGKWWWGEFELGE